MTLKLDDLDIVLKEVFKCRAKWYNIGLGLKVSVGTLDAIRSRFDDPGDCLREALKEWLKISESVHTWSTLATVLRRGPVGEGVLGCELENCCFPEQSVHRKGSRGATSKRGWKCNIGISLSILIAIVAVAVVIPLQWYNSNLPDDDVDLSKTSSDQTEIDKPSLYGYCSSEGVASNDLPYLPGRFIGRDDEVKNITDLLIHPRISHINAIGIYGRPAVGKSTLAIHVGYRMAMCGVEVRYINIYDSYHLFKQHDVRDGGKRSQAKSQPFQKDSTEMLQPDGNGHIQLPVYSDSAQKYVNPHGLLEWAKGIKNDTLLILDNCDDLLEDKLFIEIVRKLTEASAALRMIITSRQKVTVIGGFKAYYLRELDDSSAIELLQFESDYRINYTNSETIAELVGNNPLALHIAAKLVDDMHPDNVLITKLRENLIKTLTSPDILPETQNITHLLQLSFDRLENETQDCGYYLSLFLGSFDHDAAIRILHGCNVSDPNMCLKDLEASSLLAPYLSGDQPRFQYHRLIREYFILKYNSSERQQMADLRTDDCWTFYFAPLRSRKDLFDRVFYMYFSDAMYNMTISYGYAPSDELIGRFERDIHNFIMLLDLYVTPKNYVMRNFSGNFFLSDLSLMFLPKEKLLRVLYEKNKPYLRYYIMAVLTNENIITFVDLTLTVVQRMKHQALTSNGRKLVCSFLCDETLTVADCLSIRQVMAYVYYRWTCWWECSGSHTSVLLSSLLSSGILIVLRIRFGKKLILTTLVPVVGYKLINYIIHIFPFGLIYYAAAVTLYMIYFTFIMGSISIAAFKTRFITFTIELLKFGTLQVIMFQAITYIYRFGFKNSLLIYMYVRYLFSILGVFQPNLKIAVHVIGILPALLCGLALFLIISNMIVLWSLLEFVDLVTIFVTPALLVLGCKSHLMKSYPQVYEIILRVHFLLLFSFCDRYTTYFWVPDVLWDEKNKHACLY